MFQKNFKISILKKLKNLIKKILNKIILSTNGGSNLYAYLVKVSIN